MSLDPEFTKFLKELEASDNFPFEIMSIEDMRDATKKMCSLFGEKESVFQTETRTIKGHDSDFLIRIYKSNPKNNLPIVIYFHAGGYVRGDLELCDSICRKIANRSCCIVLSVNYRLAPEEVFPAALEDAYTALCWSYYYADEFGGSKDHIAVAGDSTGGNLALVLSLYTRTRKGPKISFQVLINPVLDYTFSFPSHKEFGSGFFITEEALKFYESQYFPKDIDRKNPFVSPFFIEDFKDIPTTYMITSECDPVRDEDEAFIEKLKKGNVKVKHQRFDGTFHGFIYFSTISKKAIEAIDSISVALSVFFKEAIEKAKNG